MRALFSLFVAGFSLVLASVAVADLKVGDVIPGTNTRVTVDMLKVPELSAEDLKKMRCGVCDISTTKEDKDGKVVEKPKDEFEKEKKECEANLEKEKAKNSSDKLFKWCQLKSNVTLERVPFLKNAAEKVKNGELTLEELKATGAFSDPEMALIEQSLKTGDFNKYWENEMARLAQGGTINTPPSAPTCATNPALCTPSPQTQGRQPAQQQQLDQMQQQQMQAAMQQAAQQAAAQAYQQQSAQQQAAQQQAYQQAAQQAALQQALAVAAASGNSQYATYTCAGAANTSGCCYNNSGKEICPSGTAGTYAVNCGSGSSGSVMCVVDRSSSSSSSSGCIQVNGQQWCTSGTSGYASTGCVTVGVTPYCPPSSSGTGTESCITSGGVRMCPCGTSGYASGGGVTVDGVDYCAAKLTGLELQRAGYLDGSRGMTADPRYASDASYMDGFREGVLPSVYAGDSTVLASCQNQLTSVASTLGVAKATIEQAFQEDFDIAGSGSTLLESLASMKMAFNEGKRDAIQHRAEGTSAGSAVYTQGVSCGEAVLRDAASKLRI